MNSYYNIAPENRIFDNQLVALDNTHRVIATIYVVIIAREEYA